MKVFFPRFSKEEVIKETSKCVNKLREELSLEGVVLFGSYARGDYTVASDIDLLIIFDDKKVKEDEVYRRLMTEIKLPRVELHILPKKDLEAQKGSRWLEVIENEGIRIL